MNRRAPDSGECGLASAYRGGGPGDRRYEQRWIPSSPLSKGKPSFRILKIDFACLPPHPPRQGKAKFPDITLGLVLERGCRGACSGTALCLSMVPPGRKWIFRAGFRGVHTLFVSLCQGTCRCPRHDVQFRSLGVTTVCVIVMGLELETTIPVRSGRRWGSGPSEVVHSNVVAKFVFIGLAWCRFA